ncbi:MAG: helix-turn-helix domain-containing protein [Oscillospiraceae bacterium]|nr:helix-turn-helix domain-containing protein [Oscillospiraceae bacterium]
MPESILHKLRTGDMSLSFAALNTICNILQCQSGNIPE